MMNTMLSYLARLYRLAFLAILSPFAVAATPAPPDISLINMTMLINVDDFATHHFTTDVDWIYEPRIICASVSPTDRDPIPIKVEVSVIPDNPNIKIQTEEGTCGETSTFTMEKMLFTGDESYTFKIRYKSFAGSPVPPPQLLIVASNATPKVIPAKVDTGFFNNGAFIGPAKWLHTDGAFHEMTAGVSESMLGSVLFTEHDTTGNGNPQSAITQRFIAPYTGIYRLSFDCQSVKGGVHIYNAQYLSTFTAVNEDSILPAQFTGSCTPQWQTVSHDILLLAGHAFDFRLEFDGVIVGPPWVKLRTDNLSLSYVGPAQDINTGIVTNGEFIGSQGWSSDHWGDVGVALNLGLTQGQLGSMRFKVPQSSIEQTMVPTVTDIYQLQFTCYTLSQRNSVAPKFIISTDGQIEPIVITENCARAPKQVKAKILLVVGKVYKLELIFGRQSAPGMNLIVDDVSLIATHSLVDVETGLIKNGDFIGEHSWTYVGTAFYNSVRGYDDTQLGAAVLNITNDKISQIIEPNFSGVHNLKFSCQGNRARGSWYGYRVVNEINNQMVGSGTGYCEGLGKPWSVYSFSHTLLTGNTYRVEFYAAPNTAYAIDNVAINPSPLEN